MPRIGTIKNFFDGLFSVNRFDFLSGAGYLTLGIMAGYIYRNIPIRVECDHWTNFILDPYKVSYAHIALILVIIHAFNGFGKYVYRSGMQKNLDYCEKAEGREVCSKSTKSIKHALKGKGALDRIEETIHQMVVVYTVPLFLLTLYYNYGHDYGVTGLHLVYPLTSIVPYIVTGYQCREYSDLCQVASGCSAAGIAWMHGNFYALGGHLAQASFYYFSYIRGYKYGNIGRPVYYCLGLFVCMYMFYVALLQSCVDSHGWIDCSAYYRRMDALAKCNRFIDMVVNDPYYDRSYQNQPCSGITPLPFCFFNNIL